MKQLSQCLALLGSQTGGSLAPLCWALLLGHLLALPNWSACPTVFSNVCAQGLSASHPASHPSTTAWPPSAPPVLLWLPRAIGWSLNSTAPCALHLSLLALDTCYSSLLLSTLPVTPAQDSLLPDRLRGLLLHSQGPVCECDCSLVLSAERVSPGAAASEACWSLPQLPPLAPRAHFSTEP
jgi:hypothetical protein